MDAGRDRGDVDVRAGLRGMIIVAVAAALVAFAGWLLALGAALLAGSTG